MSLLYENHVFQCCYFTFLELLYFPLFGILPKLENIKLAQMRKIIFFLLNASITASGMHVSLVKPLLPGFISMCSPCLTMEVSGKLHDTSTLGYNYHHFSQTQLTFPPACNNVLRRTPIQTTAENQLLLLK